MERSPLESQIVANILAMVRGRGAWAEKIHGGPAQRRGLPDIVLCYRGRFAGLEVKRPKKAATPIQQYALDGIASAGGVALVVHSVSEAEQVFALLERQRMPKDEDGSAHDVTGK